jgi:hypothetical protein
VQAPLALLILALLALAAPANAARERTVPRGFAGVVADGPLLDDPGVDAEAEFDRMVAAGVESVRFEVAWRSIQPYRSSAETPPAQRGRFVDEHGVPTDWSGLDRIVALGAARGLSLLPVVQGSPAWATADGSRVEAAPPSRPAYGRFLTTLAERYGSRGAFWDLNRGLARKPIRYWQVWNEPSLKNFWRDQPFARAYVRLLRTARRGLREADPKARIVLAGLPNRSWDDLASIYRQPGARRSFDVVALHPFAYKVGSALVIVATVRGVMARNGDRRKPIWATEVSWPSAKGKLRPGAGYGWETTEAGQALRVRKTYKLFGRVRTRRRLGVHRVFWYSWLSEDKSTSYSFDHAGLRRIGPGGPEPKPAFSAFSRTALRLEGCRSKALTAASCRR